MSSSEDEDEVYLRKTRQHLGVLPSIALPAAATDDSDDTDSTGSDAEPNIILSGWAQETSGEVLASPLSPPAAFKPVSPPTRQPAPPSPRDTAPPPAVQRPIRPSASPAQPAPAAVTAMPHTKASEKSPAPTSRRQTEDEVQLSPREGPSILVGAAGRLSDLFSPRRHEVVACQDGYDAVSRPMPSPAEVAALEGDINRHFHDVVSTDQPPLLPPASCGLALEDTVNTLGIDDLDGLIARLQAGSVTWDLNATRPSYLPDPSTLFSDSDSETETDITHTTHTATAQLKQPAQPQAPAGPSRVAPAQTGHGAQPRLPPPKQQKAQQHAPLPAGASAVLDTMLSALQSSSAPKPRAGLSAMEAMISELATQHDKNASDEDDDMSVLGARALMNKGAAGAATGRSPARASPAPPLGPAPATLPPRFRALASAQQRLGEPPVAAPATSAASAASEPAGGGVAGSETEEQRRRPTVVVDLRASVASALQAAKTAPKAATQARPSSSTVTAAAQQMATRSTFVSTAQAPPAANGTARPAVQSTQPATATGATHGPSQRKSMFVSTRDIGADVGSEPAAPSSVTPQPQPVAPATAADAPDRAPEMVSVSFDTEEDDWLPPPVLASQGVNDRPAPANAPGQPREKGARVVTAGARIPLPPGPPTELPRKKAAEPIATQTDPTTDTPTDTDAPVKTPCIGNNTHGVAVAERPKSGEPKFTVEAREVTVEARDVSQAGVDQTQPTVTVLLDTRDTPAARGAPAAPLLHLPRLPSGAASSDAFTLVFASSEGLTTCQVATVLEALQWGATGSQEGADKGVPTLRPVGTGSPSIQCPALSIVSVALVELPHQHALLQGLETAVPFDGSRTLLVACTPRAPAPGGVTAVAEAACGWLGGSGWQPVAVQPTSQGHSQATLVCSCRCVANAELLASLTSPPQAPPSHLHTATSQTSHRDTSSDGRAVGRARVSSDGRASAARVSNGGDSARGKGSAETHRGQGAGAHSAGGDGEATFVVSLPACALTQPLVPVTLRHASALGLRLAGLACVYPPAATAHWLATRTPHRPAADGALVALALVGSAGACAQWRAALGASHPHVAAQSEPLSLNGTLARYLQPTAQYGAVTGAMSGPTAEQELGARFNHQHDTDVGDWGDESDEGCEGVLQLTSAGSDSRQWLAFPAGSAADTARALCALRQLAACGGTVSALARTTAPAALAGQRMPCLTYGHATGTESCAMPSVVLVAEVRGMECSEQMRLCMQHMLQPAEKATAATPAAKGLWVYGCRQAEAERLGKAELRQAAQLPTANAAADALAAVEALRAQGTSQAAVDASAAADVHGAHVASQDELVLAYIQPTQHGDPAALQAALLLAAAVAARAAAPAAVPEATDTATAQRGSSAEVVAVRLLRTLPQDCARRLRAVGSDTAAGGHVMPGGAPRLHASQPGLLLALHGPDASQLLADTVQELSAGTSTQNSLLTSVASWHRLEAGTVSQAAAFATGTAADARAVLATCFHGSTQVHLDPAFHDGVFRPAASVCCSQLSGLLHVLSSPHIHGTCLALPLQQADSSNRRVADRRTGSHLSCLHRLLRAVHKEHFTVAGISTTSLTETAASTALQRPDLAGQPAVLLWLKRNNAVPHLLTTLHKAGLDNRIAVPAQSCSAAQSLLQSVSWAGHTDTTQQPSAHTNTVASLAELTAVVRSQAPQTGVPSHLLEATCAVFAASARGSDGACDWAAVGDVLGTLQGDGFQLIAARTARPTNTLVQAVLRACSRKHTDVSSRLLGQDATRRASQSGSHGGEQAAGNVLLVWLLRHNAVCDLQLCLQREAGARRQDAGVCDVFAASSCNAAQELWQATN